MVRRCVICSLKWVGQSVICLLFPNPPAVFKDKYILTVPVPTNVFDKNPEWISRRLWASFRCTLGQPSTEQRRDSSYIKYCLIRWSTCICSLSVHLSAVIHFIYYVYNGNTEALSFDINGDISGRYSMGSIGKEQIFSLRLNSFFSWTIRSTSSASLITGSITFGLSCAMSSICVAVRVLKYGYYLQSVTVRRRASTFPLSTMFVRSWQCARTLPAPCLNHQCPSHNHLIKLNTRTFSPESRSSRGHDRKKIVRLSSIPLVLDFSITLPLLESSNYLMNGPSSSPWVCSVCG